MKIGILSQNFAARAPSRFRPAPRRPPPADGRPGDGPAGELPRSIRRAAGLEDFAEEPIALPLPARATAAARAFSAGNGYLPGLIVDRLA
jgi:hypothetical protein